MKKIVKILLACVILFNFSVHIKAEDNDIYIKTKCDVNIDDYVRNNAIANIKFCNSSIDENKLRIGKGIYVFNGSVDLYVYPVWQDDTVIGQLDVSVNDEGQIGIAYTETLRSVFNCIKGITTNSNPLMLFENNRHIFICLNGKVYDSANMEEQRIAEYSPMQSDKSVITNGCVDNISYEYAISSVRSSWSTYYIYPAGNFYCVPISLYNMYKNYGMTTYSSMLAVNNEIIAANNLTYGANYTHQEIKTFLNYKNYAKIPYNFNNKLPYANVSTIVYNNSSYLLAICSNGASGHAVVVYGCGLVNGNQTLLVFDPHGTSTTGTFSVSYASPTFTSSINAIVCTWDYGYFSYCN